MATNLPIIGIGVPTLSATLGPYSVPNWSTLVLALPLAGITAPLVASVEHDPDGLDAWQPCAELDFTEPTQVGDLRLAYSDPVPGASPRVRVRLNSSALFTLASGTLQVT